MARFARAVPTSFFARAQRPVGRNLQLLHEKERQIRPNNSPGHSGYLGKAGHNIDTLDGTIAQGLWVSSSAVLGPMRGVTSQESADGEHVLRS